MEWKELLDVMIPVHGLIATATTGLKPDSDKLLAVAVRNAAGTKIFIRSDISDEELMPAAPYHGLSPEILRRSGMPLAAIKEQLAELLRDGVWYTYNKRFQASFLEPQDILPSQLVSLPALLRVADTGMRFHCASGRDLLKIADAVKEPGFKLTCIKRSIEPTPPAGILPILHNLECLETLYEKLEKMVATSELAEGELPFDWS